MTKLKALVILGSTRDGRNVTRVCKFVTTKLKEANYDVEILDPLEVNLPVLQQPLHFYPDPSKAPKILHELDAKIKAADAYIILTAEYNRQMPPALTNLLDHIPPKSYCFKTSAIVCYSIGTSGMIAATQARTLMVEFGAAPVPYFLHLPQVMTCLTENGEPQEAYLHKEADKMIKQLTWYATALRNHRNTAGVLDWPTPAMSI